MPERHVILDTETTGLSPKGNEKGDPRDRIVEIGAVEMVDYVETGRTFHTYVNPMRDMPDEAFKVHGLSAEFLADKPLFADIAGSFLDFLGDGTFTAHNAPFDLGFVNAELEACGRPPIKNPVLDTMGLARRRLPGTRVNLDALCKHFGIDNSDRDLHGALKDSLLLAKVLIPLTGRDTFLHSHVDQSARRAAGTPFMPDAARQDWFALREPVMPTEEELVSHASFVAGIKDAIWVNHILINP